METIFTFIFNLLISIMLLIAVLLFLPLYLLFKAIMFIIMEFRFFGGALLEAIRASVTKTKYPRTFEFAARIYLSEMFKSIFEICKIPFVVWKDNEDVRSKSLKELMAEEYDLYKYNWGITVFIFLSLCLSFALTFTYLLGNLIDFKNNNVVTNSIVQPLLPATKKQESPRIIKEKIDEKVKEKGKEPKPDRLDILFDFDKELSVITRLDKEIQNNSLSSVEKQEKLKILGEKFTLILNNLKEDDCANAKKVYYFAKQKLEPHYGTNQVFKEKLERIENKCLN